MCTEPKGPFYLSVRTRGITLEEAILLIMRCHTVDYRITCEESTIIVEHVKTTDRTQVQLPEHVVKKIAAILASVAPSPRSARLRSNEVAHSATIAAFAGVWGATRATQRKIANAPSIARQLAMVIGLVERDGLTFDDAYLRAQSLNFHVVIRDHD
jgi:hypothetical protein